MKGIIIAALALMVGASFNTADAASKKKKDKKAAPAPVEVKLQTMTDSLSYAAGTVRTNGLIPYLTQQLGVDTAYIADFISGYEQAMQKGMGKKEQAYYAGEQIAVMVSNRMLPMLKDEFKGYADTVNTAAFNKGFVNSLKNDTTVMTAKAAQEYFEKAYKAATDLRNAATRKAGEDFLKENALKEGVKTTPSGLQYKVITQGTGEVAGENDEVTVKYEGRLIDGTVFDSSYKRPGETAKFRPNQVIKGWTEALTMMPAGSKWELYIPQELAYGERQAGKIPACSALIFTVETVSVDKPKPAAEAATPEAKADATKAAPAKKAPAAKKKK